ncbi:MAG: hypothetical protein OEN56_11185 [Gemmatimonadota bacterium]|nr:hypothetical protein [Gemmatimonadota bacterium]MDH3424108.1 hypothetical protein [Gemmatimonadota bacterium]
MLLRAHVVPALAVAVGVGLAAQSDLRVDAPAPADRPDAHVASFAAEVLPVFEKYCWECHSDQNAELGLKLDSYEGVMAGSDYGTVIEPGDPAGSLLIDMIESGDMPEEGDPVAPADLEIIKAWIAEGAENN